MHPEGGPGQAVSLLMIGQTLGGKYEIVRLLGEGGMAFVFEASHLRLQQRVAIKLLAPELAHDAELVKRFEREARAVARLRTKHVARVIDVDATERGVPYIVMEYLEGRDLDAELRARTRIPVPEAVDYVLQACAGMLEAHGMGIVHRDLKPANLFLANDGDGHDRLVKVLDFGVSKVVGDVTRLTGAGAVMGTVMYMSPEQVRAQPNVDTRADIWALGVILYELLAGRAPWDGRSHQIAATIISRDPPDLRTLASVPDAIATAVSTMMQRDLARRFSSVRDVVAALTPFAPPGSIGAGVVEQIAMGQSGSRSRVSQLPIQTHTVPMSSRPNALDAASSAARSIAPAEAVIAARTAEPPPAVRPSAEEASARRLPLLLIGAMVVGVLGAAAVVLVVVTRLDPRARSSAASAERASSSAPAPSAAAVAPAMSAMMAAPPPVEMTPASPPSIEMTAAPPSTGTTRRTTTPEPKPSAAVSAAPAKKDAGGVHPPFL